MHSCSFLLVATQTDTSILQEQHSDENEGNFDTDDETDDELVDEMMELEDGPTNHHEDTDWTTKQIDKEYNEMNEDDHSPKKNPIQGILSI